MAPVQYWSTPFRSISLSLISSTAWHRPSLLRHCRLSYVHQQTAASYSQQEHRFVYIHQMATPTRASPAVRDVQLVSRHNVMHMMIVIGRSLRPAPRNNVLAYSYIYHKHAVASTGDHRCLQCNWIGHFVKAKASRHHSASTCSLHSSSCPLQRPTNCYSVRLFFNRTIFTFSRVPKGELWICIRLFTGRMPFLSPE